jgi:gamma-glutamyltranspeptidase/glutathione hydrolase
MTTDAARFTHRQTDNVLGLEDNLFALVGAALKAKGHNIEAVNGSAVGGYQGILFRADPVLRKMDPKTGKELPPIDGVYRAGSDHRKDGQAVGW